MHPLIIIFKCKSIVYLVLISLISVSVFITCEDVICVELHVHPVFLCYVSHDPLGAAVLLSGQ